VSHRTELPKEIIATFDYLHAHETSDFPRAQTALGAHQDEQRLWFAGIYKIDVGSQKSVVVSTMRVAQRLASTSTNLARLSALLTARR
jgi:hypothetical protein